MSNHSNELNQLRQNIDAIDQQILKLINERAKEVLKIKALKQTQETTSTIYRPEREAQLLRKLIENNSGPLNNEQVAQIFRAILSAGRELQKPLTIAFLGPEGTYSHSAVITHFGVASKLAPMNTISDVIEIVKNGRVDYGLLPIENSIEGVVNATLDALIGTELQSIGEISIPIHHHLLINPKHKKEIIRIYAHPQALAQCRHWLQINYPDVEKIATSSNGKAAQLAVKEDGGAAIAGKLAIERYQLETVQEHLEDNANNNTRFLIIGKQSVPPTGNDKTSLFVYIPNTPGALVTIAEPFAKRQINITLPISRPSGQENWNYVFYLEIAGHQEDNNVKAALVELASSAVKMQLLGSYPKAIEN